MKTINQALGVAALGFALSMDPNINRSNEDRYIPGTSALINPTEPKNAYFFGAEKKNQSTDSDTRNKKDDNGYQLRLISTPFVSRFIDNTFRPHQDLRMPIGMSNYSRTSFSDDSQDIIKQEVRDGEGYERLIKLIDSIKDHDFSYGSNLAPDLYFHVNTDIEGSWSPVFNFDAIKATMKTETDQPDKPNQKPSNGLFGIINKIMTEIQCSSCSLGFTNPHDYSNNAVVPFKEKCLDCTQFYEQKNQQKTEDIYKA